ncbi:retrovirus-related pol polyprotein from transposon TNT 1-94, partial [Tanacetum coccineum]
MIGQRSQLINFVSKFLGTVRFGNDQIAKIMGYDDYQLGNVIISRVYYVEGLGHNLFSVGQFCDSDLDVAFRKHTCYVQNLKGKSKKYSHKPKADDTNQEKLYLLHMDLCGPMRDETPEVIIKCLKQIQVRLNATVRNVRTDNGTEFVNQTLKDYYENVRITHQTSVAQAVSTACYTQNRSLIRLRYNKTPYELMHEKKPDLSFLHVFGSLCYPTNDSEDLGKLKLKADIGLMPNPPSSTPYVPPTKNDWDILFQPEFFNPPPSIVSLVPTTVARIPGDLTGSPVSTSIEQDAPSPSTSSNQEQEKSPIISTSVEEHIQSAQFDNTPFQNTPSQESYSNVQSSHTLLKLLGKWTKNHPLAN